MGGSLGRSAAAWRGGAHDGERAAGGGSAGQPVRGRRPLAPAEAVGVAPAVGALGGLVGTRLQGNSAGFALAFGV